MNSHAFHDGNACTSGLGQKRSEPVTPVQHSLTFFRNLQRINPPAFAPAKLVRQCDSPRLAMQVSLKARGMKRLVCARMLGVSESYLCRLVNERQPMPEWFVAAFTWATGSLLLEQFLDAQDDSEAARVRRLADVLRSEAA